LAVAGVRRDRGGVGGGVLELGEAALAGGGVGRGEVAETDLIALGVEQQVGAGAGVVAEGVLAEVALGEAAAAVGVEVAQGVAVGHQGDGAAAVLAQVGQLRDDHAAAVVAVGVVA